MTVPFLQVTSANASQDLVDTLLITPMTMPSLETIVRIFLKLLSILAFLLVAFFDLVVDWAQR